MKGMKLSLSALALALLAGCGSGSSLEEQPDEQLRPVTIALSDAPVDDAEQVVITIDQLILRPANGGADLVINTFTNSNEGLVNVDTISVDLLEYQGGAKFNILENLQLPAGTYQHVLLIGPFGDINKSYVVEANNVIKPLKVPSNELKLGQLVIASEATSPDFTIEFDLRQSMNYKPGPQEYTLKPRGVRIVDDAAAGTINGIVDEAQLDAGEGCDAWQNAEEGAVFYLYSGSPTASSLSDVADPDSANNGIAAGAALPFATAPIYFDAADNRYEFSIGAVPAGNYSLALACNTGLGDDPERADGIAIPNPANALARFSLAAGKTVNCRFDSDSSGCSQACSSGSAGTGWVTCISATVNGSPAW